MRFGVKRDVREISALAHVQNVYEVYYRPYGGRHIGNSEVDDVIMLF